MGEQNKMKAASAPPVLLSLLLIVLLSSAPACRGQRTFLSKYIWRSKLQRPLMQTFGEEQMGRPQETSQERFQPGAGPADESQEVDMRMILDALKRDMQAAIEGEEATSKTEEEEPNTS